MLPQKLQWAIANSDLIRDLFVLRQKPCYSPKRRVIRSLVGWTDRYAGTLFLTRLVGLVMVTRWWWRSGPAKRKLPDQCRIFVGFGAVPEEHMWHQFLEESCEPAVRLDQTKAATFGCFYRPTLLSLWKEIWFLANKVLDFLGNITIKQVVLYRKDFITFAVLRMSEYVFYNCWWRGNEDNNISQVVFITGGLAAHGCLNSGFSQVEYRQHGLLQRSGLMPAFPIMLFLTKKERDFYSPFFPETITKVVSTNIRVKEHRPIILIASIYDTGECRKSDALKVLTELFAWADDNGLQIIIRMRPRENDNFWQSYFPQSVIDHQHDNFSNALLRLRPMIMVTWFSTTIIDALRCNVVPVSICDMSDNNVQILTLNLEDHCLLWSDSRELLDQLVTGKTTVEFIVERLNKSA